MFLRENTCHNLDSFCIKRRRFQTTEPSSSKLNFHHFIGSRLPENWFRGIYRPPGLKLLPDSNFLFFSSSVFHPWLCFICLFLLSPSFSPWALPRHSGPTSQSAYKLFREKFVAIKTFPGMSDILKTDFVPVKLFTVPARLFIEVTKSPLILLASKLDSQIYANLLEMNGIRRNGKLELELLLCDSRSFDYLQVILWRCWRNVCKSLRERDFWWRVNGSL